MFRHRPVTSLVAMLLLWAFLLGVGAAPNPAQALDLGGGIGSLVKIFGIGWVVDHFSGKINDAINNALRQHQAEIQGYTKVVPILRVGAGGTAVGAAQVMGPREQVQQVQAVAEIQLSFVGAVRARGLIPVSSKNLTNIKSVGGVGVSANIKFPI